jgi:dolichol-phosphate mannosyltransferase|tara:strand:- start:1474 stop:2190 length:717 start_codon:yes stop_codon:yes gene_type:complete
MSLTVIIPIKDEEKIIKDTLNSFNESWINSIDYEILFINDHCKDDTVNIIKNSKFDKLNIQIRNNTKKGLGSAITEGINHASKKFICIFMADLSDSIEDLKIYYESMNNDENLDAIFGSRFIKNSKIKNYPKFKLFLNRLANNIIKLVFFSKYNDFTNAFKIYKKDTLLKLYPLVSENFNIFLELPLKLECRKYNFKVIPISWNGRNFGESKFKLKELGSKYIFTMLYCLLEKILLKK